MKQPKDLRPKLAKIENTHFAAVIRAYENSREFARLSEGTKSNYRRVLRLIESPKTLGAKSVYSLRPSIVQGFLDGLADRPGAQYMARAVIGTIESWAIVRDLLPQGITAGTKAPGSDGGHDPWPDALVDLGERAARADLARVITLMVNTGQRGSDIVRMRLNDIEERKHEDTGRVHLGINVKQKKTGVRLWVPMTDTLIEAIESWRKDIRAAPWLLVTTPDGIPYTRPILSWHWNYQRDHAPALEPLKDAGLVLHGLRGTCVVRLRKRGASVLEICSMIGMSEPMVSRYSRFADRADMAMSAVHRLNSSPKDQTKNRGII